MNKQNKGFIPELRFPEFLQNPGWEAVYGNKAFEQIKDKNHNSDLPILAITQDYGAIPRKMIDYNVSVTEKSIQSYKVVDVGDFIISLRSFQGGIEYSEYKGLCSPAYVVLRNKKGFDKRFFKQYFKAQSFIRDLTKNLEGLRDGKMISYKQFSEILLPQPSPKEQQKIADFLASIDEMITLHTEKLGALKAHKKGLMQQLFPAEGKTVPKLRFPEFQNKDEWKVRKVDSLAKRGSGHTPNKRMAEYYNGGIKWVSLADSHKLDKGYIYETKVEISSEGLKNSSAVLHPRGTVIISRDAGVGKSAILHSDMAVSQHFIAWVCDTSKLVNWFLYYQLQKLKPTFEMIAVGNTIKTIGLPYFKELCITVPSIEEQTKISEVLMSIDENVTLCAKKIENLKRYKKGLVQKLFPMMDDATR
ncbi:restriction endonuclease subunit S [Enterobacter hormaechei]|uniref:restriction endonuclease subunit S n=1 Tax=Enterobacter hormaechei TaxID=158836 RepID=UPI00321CADC5